METEPPAITSTKGKRDGALVAVERSLAVIADRDPALRACITVRGEAARQEARVLEASSGRGPLHGWTVAVKDNMDVAGTVRTDGLTPPLPTAAEVDCEAVRRLRRAGAVIVAKANLEELSFAATTQNRTWGRCRNPWDPGRIPGGSSGGSAVAVAAGMVDLGLGTDTGGSIRNPAAFCGVTGLRPTVGAVPTDGVTPLSPEFDVVGPIARSAEHLREAFAVLAGAAPPGPRASLAGTRVGVPEPFFFDDLDPAVAAGVEKLIEALRELGAELTPLRLAGAERTPETIAVLLNGEAARIHADRLEEGRLDPQIEDRLRLGLGFGEAARKRARRTAEGWRRAVRAAFETVEMIVVPATPRPAPPIDGTHMVELSRHVNRFNAAWSLTGVPVVSVPCDPGGSALPVGAQLVGGAGGDIGLLDRAVELQRHTDWHRRRPPRL